MARLLSLATRRSIEEQAAGWLTRIDAGLTPERRAELDAWMRADPRHARTLIRLAAVWDDMGVLHELSTMFPLPEATPPAHARPLPRWSVVGAIAASVVALAVAVRVFVPPDAPTAAVASVGAPAAGQAGSSSGPGFATVLSTKVGEQRSERLPDGSVVQLNTATEIRVAFTHGERRITLLRGESQFDVMHDAGRPFLVSAGGRTIRAVGTAFNVRVVGDRVEVFVTEGRVAIADARPAAGPRQPAAIEVSAGELAQLGRGPSSVARADPADASAKLAWQRGIIVFNGEPLASALEEVQRYTSLRFELADPALGELRIGGYYKVGDVEGLEQSLVENFPLVVSREGDRVIIRAAEPR